jgi:hypothetical protein
MARATPFNKDIVEGLVDSPIEGSSTLPSSPLRMYPLSPLKIVPFNCGFRQAQAFAQDVPFAQKLRTGCNCAQEALFTPGFAQDSTGLRIILVWPEFYHGVSARTGTDSLN